MANDLYRIELLASQDLPEIDCVGMLYANEGFAFVKLHKVKINVKPNADILKVVRCKDCKHYVDGPYDNGDMMCDCWGEWIFPNDNDFCSQGERKDNGNQNTSDS